MRLTILGCSGSIPGPNAAASGYLVEADGFVLGLELGNGTLAQLQAVRDPFDLGALVLSHLHPDHCADFSALTVLRRYHPAPPYDVTARRLPVYGPVEAPARLANAYAPHEAERVRTDLTDVFEFHPLSAGPVRVGPFELSAVPMDHPTEAFGLRLSHGGRTLAYTGDTGPCETLDKLAADADVLLAEASWTDAPDRPAGVHLSGRQAGELAARAGAGRLLLTHIAPWSDREAILAEARAAFTGLTDLVEQGASYDV
ncbi:MBL fold metallo-hydrolase [Prauserella sp. PE36]|uniref:MBL fold metallo-hydrolase n=1 Tax=Prauserella endophytica TaxID=1592324 RepID=A0ABY2RYZ9_9PSEU|nr:MULTISPECIES: MBL fold metallo-hydrolase [Prauserella]PXY26874.1 MBL fold metallo-hydrolase [Prauserella coralliicola]RBM15611.1 MBL fold metallo-hydrolase [Prauserella sp. PE36]TKG66228.1 MBL fold metallo-hydrolase [Prauserella endophytica]